jgi:CBS domain-containing protein
MGQTVSDIMSKNLVSLSADDTVREAARQMRQANVGAIVVQKQGDVFGIVTDRDIVVRCLAHGSDCDDTPLSEICTEDVTTLRPDDEVDRAVTLMRDKAIRRIPIVKNGKAVGILSLGDLALERDPFSVLGAISGASPNNELRRPDRELRRTDSALFRNGEHDLRRAEPDRRHTEPPLRRSGEREHASAPRRLRASG